ncbi:MAG TPA: type II toxin-antitoxin system Phd/YefM family antitoxin [Chthonomonadaceae bacterium]|nr:type II toxin-antitoxin system Phd/YefM family antitoxin [Chthonomonadaceae bacterium]
MTTATATDVKNHFGEYIEKAQREPVIVQKSGRKVAVIISQADYERFEALEDRYWSERARMAQESGYIGSEETMTFLKGRLDED